MKTRDYIDEILRKRSRLHVRTERESLFHGRVFGVVAMFRTAKRMDKRSGIRAEMLRASAIGYIGCVEGYFKLLVADLIDGNSTYRANVAKFKQLPFRPEDVLSLYERNITLGEYVAHLLPMNGISVIESNLTTIIGKDFMNLIKNHRVSDLTPRTLDDLMPNFAKHLHELFTLRHLFAHELATKFPVRAGNIERGIASGAIFVSTVEYATNATLLTQAPTMRRNRGIA